MMKQMKVSFQGLFGALRLIVTHFATESAIIGGEIRLGLCWVRSCVLAWGVYFI